MSNIRVSDEELIIGFAKKLAFYVDSMNISADAKELFIEIFNKLPIDVALQLAKDLEEKFASERLELLNIQLENDLEKLAIEYVSNERKIDDVAIEKIKNIFNQK